MTYIINNYDGTPLVGVADRAINLTATSIKLPGRDYRPYGEPIVENLVYMLQHFAGASSPINPIRGQIWYDTNSQALKVYSGTSWLSTGKTVVGNTFPPLGDIGSIFYHTDKKQLFVAEDTWRLVGPIGSANDTDTQISTTPTQTTLDAIRIGDGTTFYNVIRMIVGGEIVAILSRDTFTPSPTITGFTQIKSGLNLRTGASYRFAGVADSAIQATNSTTLAGVAATVYMRRDQSNVPETTDIYDLGSSSNKYANVWALTFNGTATSARYADVAERYHVDEPVTPGTVVELGGTKEICMTKQSASEQVLGVISTAPALMLNAMAGSDETHPYVALLGRVPVRVIGPVKKGDRLMSSEVPGVACVAPSHVSSHAILGRSLETKTQDAEAIVEAVVGVK